MCEHHTCIHCDNPVAPLGSGRCERHLALDTGELYVCHGCDEDVKTVDDEGVCGECRAESEHVRQLHGDYYAGR